MLAGRTLVAHNLAVDLTFLDAEYDRPGVPSPDPRTRPAHDEPGIDLSARSRSLAA